MVSRSNTDGIVVVTDSCTSGVETVVVEGTDFEVTEGSEGIDTCSSSLTKREG